MNPTLEEKIISTNQKYLKHFLHQELPQKLENQLEDFEWSYLDLISENEQKRRTFAPLGAMTLAQIEENKEAKADKQMDMGERSLKSQWP